MKRKYSGSLALALWLCVVAWVGAMIVAKPGVERTYVDGDESAAIAQLQLDIDHNHRLLAAVDALRAVDLPAGRGLAVAPTPAAPAGSSDAWTGTGPNASGHRVSLILSTDNGRRAVVDGQLARQGTRLADGSLVRAIRSDRVLLEDADGQRLVLRIPRPFAGSATGAEARR